MVRRIFFTLGLLVLALIPVWYLAVLPLVNSLPVNFNQVASVTHSEDNRFDIGGNWSGKTISIGSIDDRVTGNENSTAFMESKFDIQSLTGEPLFSLTQKFVIDRRTMKNYPSEKDTTGGSYFLFPRHLGKTTYRWWPNTFGEPLDVTFVELKKIDGLITYHFRGQRSDINDTVGYEFLPLVPEKYLALSRATVDVFVEPNTGTVIDYRDDGVSYYATPDKKPVWDMAKWSNKFSDESVRSRIGKAEVARAGLFKAEILVPLTALAASLIFIYLGATRKT